MATIGDELQQQIETASSTFDTAKSDAIAAAESTIAQAKDTVLPARQLDTVDGERDGGCVYQALFVCKACLSHSCALFQGPMFRSLWE